MFEKEIAAANEEMLRKMNEFQIACDTLAMWKLREATMFNRAQEKTVPSPTLAANAKATKVIRFKQTGYTVATLKRRKNFLAFVKSRNQEMISYEELVKHVALAAELRATFKWCKGLSDVSVLGLYQYCKKNF